MADYAKINSKHQAKKKRFLSMFPYATPAQFECLHTRKFGKRYKRGIDFAKSD